MQLCDICGQPLREGEVYFHNQCIILVDELVFDFEIPTDEELINQYVEELNNMPDVDDSEIPF